MKTLYKFVLLSGYILCAFGNNQTISKWKYSICYDDSKHCIQCFQTFSAIIYEKSFPQEDYRVRLMDQLNRVRSQYANAHRITNMKFTNWVPEFEAMAAEMSSVSTPIIDCSELKNNLTDRFSYKILDLHVKIELGYNSNLNEVLRLQLDNFTRQMLNSNDMMAWNLNEFGCCYSFNERGTRLSTLFRCILYNENRRYNFELKSHKMCNDCDRSSERCIDLDLYKGLCVPNLFNETRLRLRVDPERQKSFVISPVIWILAGAIILSLFCLIYYVANKLVFRRHNNQAIKQPVVIFRQGPSAPY